MQQAQAPQVTERYDNFKFLLNNRDRGRGHIENIKKAFEEQGNITAVQPILVNENMEIIDGQHRFDAAKELGLPIYYTVIPGLGIHDARQMNILHKSWDTDDYARSYADGGDANYRRYLQLREDFPYSHSIILLYLNGDERKGQMSGFRQGELTITPEQVEDARKRLQHLADVGEFMSMHHQKEFALALLKSMGTVNYDQKRMITKMENANEPPRFASTLDYQRALEEIYNWKVMDANRVRLF